MLDELKQVLDYLESVIDPDEIDARIERHKKAAAFEPLDRPCVNISHPCDRKRFAMEEIHADIEKMMYNELVDCIGLLISGSSSVPMIRANYGVGILPSVFGAKCRIVGGNMPWADPIGLDAIKKHLSAGVPDYRGGYGQRILDTYAFYNETLKAYPKCQRAIRLYQPDYQGPFDVAHLLWGADIYADLYDEPEMVCDLMELVVDTYIDGMERVKPLLNDDVGGGICQWKSIFPGSILVRNDSAVNLSKDMYLEFVRPYDEKLLEHFGGGSIHFCGRADQWIAEMAKTKGIKAINFGYMGNIQFGQPYLDFIKPFYYDQKIPTIGYTLSRDELASFDFGKYRTGVAYTVYASSPDDAKQLLDSINK